MADNHNARYRSNDPYGQPSAANEPMGDPLAELARLIGRNDPFADVARSPAPPVSAPSYASEPEPSQRPYSDDEGQAEPEQPAVAPVQAPAFDPFARAVHQAPAEGEQHYDTRAFLDARNFDPHKFAPLHSHELEAYSRPAPAHDRAPPPREEPQASAIPEPSIPEPSIPEPQQYVQPEPPRVREEHRPFVPPPFVPPPFVPPPQTFNQESFARAVLAHDTQHQQAAASFAADRESPVYAEPTPPMADPQAFPITPPPFLRNDGAPPRPEFYEDEARGGHRKGLVTVFAVLCLAVLGTAGAFAFRSVFSGSSSSAPPPVIRASVEPTKVAPPPPAADPSSTSKLSYDRFGDRGQNEQVLVREEKPVEPRDIVRSSPPRVVLPGAPNVGSGSGAPPQQQQQQASANPSSTIGEPKRIRTVPIRPDQPESVSAPPPRSQAAAPPPPMQRQSADAAAPANEPVELAPPAAQARASAPPPAPRTTVASRQTQQPPASGNAPMSLTPDNGASAPPAAAPIRTASTGGRGGYHVQVASQRSEADAQSSYRSIQSKYSSVLGDKQSVIRRADLGEKGTYYRAMVGPFTTREQAIQLCGSLKAAGGDCVVQSN